MRELAGDRAGKPASLPMPVYETLLDDLRGLGTGEIYFAGGGEPLAHPNAWKALESAVQKGFVASLHTNWSLAGEEGIDEILRIGVHHLTVSLWAGDGESYEATHPGTKKETFYSVVAGLTALAKRRVDRPKIKPYHVLTRANATVGRVERMWGIADEIGADAVEFAVADLVPGGTDHLSVTPEQAKSLLPLVEGWLGRALWRAPRLLGGPALFARLSAIAESRPADSALVHQAPCFAGWTYARVLADGRVIPCLKAHRVPSGTLHQERFPAIWDGARQRAFRSATRSVRKEGPYFQKIGNDEGANCGCELGCDNLADNAATASQVAGMTRLERAVAMAGAAWGK